MTIQLAISAFDEEASFFHNQLVECGVGLVLTRCLTRSLSHKERLVEIDGICQLLLIFFRCSNDFATKTLQSLVGELYPLLLAILLMKSRVPTWIVPDSTFRLTERLSSLPIKLHQIDQKDYISDLFREAITICRNHSAEKEVVSAIFQLLTGMVLNMNSRRHILTLPNFVAGIIASFECFRKASYHVAAFLLVAAQDRDSRLLIVETEGFIPDVLSSLLKDESTTVRKVAIALVKVIAVDSAGRTALLTVESSKLFNSLFECAKKGVVEDDCLESIQYLINSDTAKSLCEEDRLLEQILPENAFDSKSTQHDVIVAKIIYRMSSFCYVNGKGMSRLVDIILQLSNASCPKVRYLGVKALAKQTKIEACSFFLIHTPTVANIVAKTLASLVGGRRS